MTRAASDRASAPKRGLLLVLMALVVSAIAASATAVALGSRADLSSSRRRVDAAWVALRPALDGRYGRLLAYVEFDGRRFNDELLTGGYARVLVIPPNGRHGRAMLDEELAARSAERGLWGACTRPDGR